MLNEHDITKNMLNKIRGLIKEQDENNGINLIEKNKNEYDIEVKKITETIDPKAVIESFNIYPNDRDVIVMGKLSYNISFIMSLKEDNARLKTEGDDYIKLNDDVVKMLTRLNGYYINWTKEWATKINEYGQA